MLYFTARMKLSSGPGIHDNFEEGYLSVSPIGNIRPRLLDVRFALFYDQFYAAMGQKTHWIA
jgi:hypothetical protein